MCQACLPPDSTATETAIQQSDGTAVAPREMSLLTLVGMILGALVGCFALMGTVLWLVLWLQPQLGTL